MSSTLHQRIPVAAALAIGIVGCNEARPDASGADTGAADAGGDSSVLDDVSIDAPGPRTDVIARPDAPPVIDAGENDVAPDVTPPRDGGRPDVPPPRDGGRPDVRPPRDAGQPDELPEQIREAIARFCEVYVDCGGPGLEYCQRQTEANLREAWDQSPNQDDPACVDGFAEVFECYGQAAADDCSVLGGYGGSYPCQYVQYDAFVACGFDPGYGYGYDG